MSSDETEPPSRPRAQAAGGWLRAARVLAWGALVGVTGLLVRAETTRPQLPEGVDAFTDITYRRVGQRRVRLDVYVPRGPVRAGGRPAILALHGGGWRGGSKTTYGRDVARLAQHGYVVVAADYLLSRPEAPSWPENLHDVREAVRWMRRHAADHGIDPERIAVLGSSAGGHLAALLGTCPGEPGTVQGRADVSARVQAVVDFYGPSDLDRMLATSPAAASPIAMLVGGSPHEQAARRAAASPLRHVSAAAAPMLLIHGQADSLVPPEQSQSLASALHMFRVRQRVILVSEQGHGFGMRVKDRDLVPEILAFLEAVWKDREENP